MAAGKPVPILDLTRYDEELKREIARGVEAVFASGRFVMGPVNEAFERAFAERIGVTHAIGVTSGTDALLVLLMALGVGPGDEVITSAFSFVASASVVARLRAKPVFVDIDPATFNLDSSKLEAVITPRTKAIEPVHLYGQGGVMGSVLLDGMLPRTIAWYIAPGNSIHGGRAIRPILQSCHLARLTPSLPVLLSDRARC